MARAIHLNQISELILDNIKSGIVYCDLSGKILYINKRYADFLGINKEEAIGKHITEYLPQSRLPYVIKTGKAELYQKCSCLDRELIVNRIPVKQGNRVVGAISQAMFKDISEIKELVDRLNFLEGKVLSLKNNLKSILSARYTFDDIKGESKEILNVKSIAYKYSKSNAPVLIIGATGTGKELFAHAIHTSSYRREGPFVSINCAGIPKDLIEAELFGYVRGAFTGAHPGGKTGKIEMADKGTLFLDEIGDLPLSAQGKLLRVLEEKVVERIGDTNARKIDFRLISATNKDLQSMIQRGEFREDLYYRISALTLHVPSLKERTEDIPILAHFFLLNLGLADATITSETLDILKRYDWPGNVRELKNAISYAVSIIDNNHIIQPHHLPPEIQRKEFEPFIKLDKDILNMPLSLALSNFEMNLITKIIERNKGNIRKTAKQLGISRSTLYYKLKRYNMLSE
jgi:transcriptional regulator with PAS, ATPase and Fis domain